VKPVGKLPRAYIVAALVITYVPIFLVIAYSFNASRISSVWGGFSLEWYGDLFRDRSMFQALFNSLTLALLSSLAAAAVGTLGAVGMSRVSINILGMKPNNLIEYLSTLPIMIPEIILGMVFLVFFALIGLPFGLPALVVSHTVFCVPYVFMMVKARLAGMDKSYVEAAKDLGASELRAFYDITFPLLRPAIVSGMLLAFAMSMDDVIVSMFVSNVNTNTLPLKIYSQIKTGVTPKTNALCALMFLITVLMGLGSFWIGRRPQNDKNGGEK
jgi:spermidine/putrescine transport system permease protein